MTKRIDVSSKQSFHGVGEADVLSRLPFDQHVGKADGVGLRIVLLTEQAHVCVRIHSQNEVVAGGEHSPEPHAMSSTVTSRPSENTSLQPSASRMLVRSLMTSRGV